jgi:hypothetical protein
VSFAAFAAVAIVIPSDTAVTSAQYDGPAELPRVHVHSLLAETPAPGHMIAVHAGDDLQKAIDQAQCGDVIKLQADATFRGAFHLPDKACDDSHWIILRSGAPDSDLPPEGARINPCSAGVTSLPGRPDFHCTLPRHAMAKIEFDGNGDSGPILFSAGANHYRLIGLEVTRAKPQFHMRHLISPEKPDSTAHHLVFDRLWVHGTAQDETKDGVHLSGTTYVAIVDSYFSDFHCIAKWGSCTDAQAVNGGTGDAPGGPYKIENNFLEASGENILFGGAAGSTTPADIEIRHNHFFKPLRWKPGQPDFVGSYSGDPYIVKNLFELKNAQRVVIEGNVMENSWGGFSQAGFAILLLPANQGGKCPSCKVTDVTIRYNRISHVAGVVDIATSVSRKDGAVSAGGERFSIHDLIVDDIDPEAYKGFGVFAVLVSNTPPLHSVHIDHVTAFPPRTLISVLNTTGKIQDFAVTNSIFSAGTRGIASAGGGRTNCTLPRDSPLDALTDCFSNYTFTHNLIIGAKKAWPAGNILVPDTTAAGVRDFRGGNGGDYRICKTAGAGSCQKASPAIGGGTDGKDLGADFEAVQAQIRVPQ